MNRLMIVCLALCCGFSSGCKPPQSPTLPTRISMSGGPSRLGGGVSNEIINGRNYYVLNEYYCPSYYDYEDWGIFILSVGDITDRKVALSVVDDVDWETEFQPYRISINNRSEQSSVLLIGGKSVTCKYEKNLVTVLYNDESGNCYRTQFEMNDPRVTCLFYDSTNKNRTELIDLWNQLNKEKDDHTIIYEAMIPLPLQGGI